jgi:hypothetical protein
MTAGSAHSPSSTTSLGRAYAWPPTTRYRIVGPCAGSIGSWSCAGARPSALSSREIIYLHRRNCNVDMRGAPDRLAIFTHCRFSRRMQDLHSILIWGFISRPDI